MGKYLIPRLFVPIAWWQGRDKWKKKHLCDDGCIMPHPNVWNICYDLEKQEGEGTSRMKYIRSGRYDSRWRCRHSCKRCGGPCDILLKEITSDNRDGLEVQRDYYAWKNDENMVTYVEKKLEAYS